MDIKPTVAMRAAIAAGIAACAKLAGVIKASGGLELGPAAAAISGLKKDFQ